MIRFSEKEKNVNFPKNKIMKAKDLTVSQKSVLSEVKKITLVNSIDSKSNLLNPSDEINNITLFEVELKIDISLNNMKSIYSILAIEKTKVFINFVYENQQFMYYEDLQFDDWFISNNESINERFMLSHSNVESMDEYFRYLMEQIKFIKYKLEDDISLETLELIEKKVTLEDEMDELNKQLKTEYGMQTKIKIRKQISELNIKLKEVKKGIKNAENR